MLKHKRLLALVAGVATLASIAAVPGAASAAGPTAGNTIIEGVGTPGLQLGMSRNQIVAANPNSYCASGAECYVPGEGGYTRIQFSGNTIIRLDYTNADSYTGWYTSAGVTPTSTLNDVAARYGAAVTGDTVNVPSRGYSVQQFATYNCGDSGCRPNGSFLRHSVFATSGGGGGGGGGQVTNKVQGSIVIRNTARSSFKGTVTLAVTNPSGARVANKQVSVSIPGRGNVTIDPATVIDVKSSAVGTYNWTATTGSGRKTTTLDRGSFNIVAG